jgi:hypothetical protein
VLPQFGDFIKGDSPEEVDAAIELARANTTSIRAEIASYMESGGQAAPEPQPEISDADLAAMTLTEYAEARHTMGTGMGNPNGRTRNVRSWARWTGRRRTARSSCGSWRRLVALIPLAP